MTKFAYHVDKDRPATVLLGHFPSIERVRVVRDVAAMLYRREFASTTYLGELVADFLGEQGVTVGYRVGDAEHTGLPHVDFKVVDNEGREWFFTVNCTNYANGITVPFEVINPQAED